MVTSRSVPLIRTALSLIDSISTLASTGMVLLRSTTLWTKVSSVCNASLGMVNFIVNSPEGSGGFEFAVPMAAGLVRSFLFESVAQRES
jgi:hypothetical protein